MLPVQQNMIGKAATFLMFISILTSYSGRRHKNYGRSDRHRGNKRPGKHQWHGYPGKVNGKGHHHFHHEHGKPDLSGMDNCSGKNLLMMKTVEEVKKQLKEKLFKNRPDRFAHSLRIAFHDCVGGCDGCINRANSDNAGPMLDSLDVMDKIYEDQIKKKMSRADFYILTAVTALEESLKFNNANLTSSFIKPVKFNFKYGRCDCKTSPNTDIVQAFPSGQFGYHQVVKFFKKEFGFNLRDSVAIMGAHTLGGASGRKGSGFEGFWKEDGVAAARLNNRYYSILTDKTLNWENVDRSLVTRLDEERWQWQAGTTPEGVPAPFMLNADVSLIRKIQPGVTGKSSCQFSGCPLSPTAGIVQEFAKNGNKWIRDFVRAWDKMVAKGSRKLKYPV